MWVKNRVVFRGLMIACTLVAACGGSPHDTTMEVSDGGGVDAVAANPQIAFFSRPTPTDEWTPTTLSFWGDQVAVRLSGLGSSSQVTVTAKSASYQSSADFKVKADGSVDLSADAPVNGGYSGVDPDGLFWSMTSDDPTTTEAYPIVVSVSSSGETLVSATLNRYWTPPKVFPIPVTDNGLNGVFVTPASSGPHPALILFGGSEGGLSSGALDAEYYASLGYSCLGLAYFGASGLPNTLAKIPLEYFKTAIDWLKARPEVDPAQIGVMGGSRGGELALLLGATYPDIKAVIATVPSGVVWASLSGTQAAWTLGGVDIPYVPLAADANPSFSTDADGNQVEVDAPIYLTSIKEASASALMTATIQVEKTNGPILMLAGQDDQLWASCTLAQIAMDRLTMSGHASTHADDFQCYAATGHNVYFPGIPSMDASEYQDTFGNLFWLGGTAAGIAHAARDSDARIRKFLRASLGAN